jgi:ketosteroid isomerase-like protein
MNTLEVANKLVELVKAGKLEDAVTQLYSPEIVSVEPGAPPGVDREARGLEGIRKKNEWWTTNHDVHSMTVEGPWPNGDRFIVRYDMDITQKATQQRFQMREAALYEVKDGKIVREEFFYSMG